MIIWPVLAQVINVHFADFCSVSCMTYTDLAVTRVLYRWGGQMRFQCVHCLCLARLISFQPNAGATTDHSQSEKGIDPYFIPQLYVKDSGHRKPVLMLPNGVIDLEESPRWKLISSVGGIRTHNLLSIGRRLAAELPPLYLIQLR